MNSFEIDLTNRFNVYSPSFHRLIWNGIPIDIAQTPKRLEQGRVNCQPGSLQSPCICIRCATIWQTRKNLKNQFERGIRTIYQRAIVFMRITMLNNETFQHSAALSMWHAVLAQPIHDFPNGQREKSRKLRFTTIKTILSLIGSNHWEKQQRPRPR